ncbi:MAG TPA: type II toxin-antitoxin system VapC family toxin [Candidatus Angelobacter sp.]|jgi:PIN domain nuclease of toxin-antitoxin system|nr:type II toxin-antitoxin system VapC family toxin [Candidatus Angelobacter sp.]
MKLLLDTHIWIWMAEEPINLKRRVQQELQNEANELWLSPISTWEVLLLHSKRRLHFQSDAVDWIAQATQGFREAPLTHEIVVTSRQLQLPHADPADRFLAATAKVLGLMLVTSDAHLLGLGDISTLSNR